MPIRWWFGTTGGLDVVPWLPTIYLLQVAVKALRFKYTLDGDTEDKSNKAIYFLSNNEFGSNLDAVPRCFAESLESGRD